MKEVTAVTLRNKRYTLAIPIFIFKLSYKHFYRVNIRLQKSLVCKHSQHYATSYHQQTSDMKKGTRNKIQAKLHGHTE